MPKIVILDAHTTNPGDLDWKPIRNHGELTVYDRTPVEEVLKRCKGANVILTNKVVFDEAIFEKLPDLQLISTLSTGYNTINIEAAKKHNVRVCNVSGYSTTAVAQQVFAYLLNFSNMVEKHNASVQAGEWENHIDWCYFLQPVHELEGKTLSILGLGKIGKQVAKLALAFGMKVLAYRKNEAKGSPEGVKLVDLENLFSRADFLTLHAPLTSETEGIVQKKMLAKMKSTAVLINTGRGGLVVENDLRIALETGVIAGAAVDVLSSEPPRDGNVLIGLKNCLITPHNAWMSVEARSRLIEESGQNIAAFLEGKPRNVVA